MDQGSLFGFEAPPPPTDRIFFALMPDAEAAGRIAALQSRLRAEFGLTGRAIATERLHVTLSHVGDYAGLPADIVEQARRAGAAAGSAGCECLAGTYANYRRTISYSQHATTKARHGLVRQ